MVISSSKYEVVNTMISLFESRMVLTVRHLTSADCGRYRCVAKNSLGEVDSVIRLDEIPGPATENTSPVNPKEDFKYSTPIEGPDNQFGSAERSDDEDDHEILPEPTINSKPYLILDNSTKNRMQNYSSTLSNNISNKVNKITYKKLDNTNSHTTNSSNEFYLSFCFYIVFVYFFFKYK